MSYFLPRISRKKRDENDCTTVSVYFPQEPGEYAVLYFLGGLRAYLPVEFYSIFMSKLASHGFFVFGVDYAFPLEDGHTFGEDLNKYFEELTFVSNK